MTRKFGDFLGDGEGDAAAREPGRRFCAARSDSPEGDVPPPFLSKVLISTMVLRPAPGKERATIYTIYATDQEERRLVQEALHLKEIVSTSWQRGFAER